MREISFAELTNAGERMVVGNMWGYWAHLSIYRFAVPFAQGKRVLDAGSGAGYGSAYLARYGANVLALDGGAVAIEHSRQIYAGDSVTFEVADLNAPLRAGDDVFDLVFSSNVFEHIANVDGLAAECARVVKPDGAVIVAVPPICSATALAADMDNQFHVNHIPPPAWAAKLRRFFATVECHSHFGTGEFAGPAAITREISLPHHKVTIRESDFEFPETDPDEMLRSGMSITAIFVCRGPKKTPDPETILERTPASWREGEAAANKIAEMRSTIDGLNTSIATLRSAMTELETREMAAEVKIARLRSRSVNGRLRSLRKAFGLK
jgi:SAM-dependent methyltransferase